MIKRRRRVDHSAGVHLCGHCGRELEDMEVCECMMRTRDGLRAVCPEFKARSSFMGVHYIVCRKKLRFVTLEARNRYYADFCCGKCAECAERKSEVRQV